MLDEGNALSRNPNVCASCSSMADGMEGGSLLEMVSPTTEERMSAPGSLEEAAPVEKSALRAD